MVPNATVAGHLGDARILEAAFSKSAGMGHAGFKGGIVSTATSASLNGSPKAPFGSRDSKPWNQSYQEWPCNLYSQIFTGNHFC